MAKSSKNGARLKSVYAKYIAEIVQREIKNPHIGMVSINEVVVNADNSLCKVYVTFLGAPHEVRFLYDESFERASSLEEALRKESEDLANMDIQDDID